jgi:hypothetical protein
MHRKHATLYRHSEPAPVIEAWQAVIAPLQHIQQIELPVVHLTTVGVLAFKQGPHIVLHKMAYVDWVLWQWEGDSRRPGVDSALVCTLQGLLLGYKQGRSQPSRRTSPA